jgi:hypothetical protein
MSYICSVLEILFDPERDKQILTNPSLGELKGHMKRWEAHSPINYTRFVIHKGNVHFASALHHTHWNIAHLVSGEENPHYQAGQIAAWKWRADDSFDKVKTKAELRAWAHNSYDYEYPEHAH